ncbi:TRAPP II complex [Calycina marina]|uniref:TRAPP II complex n=1 Tax=Calycina marina TaxID=1763456 RepID=A0A9P7Z1A4_9HELO|nr:TRAPP II complex [Calycina marina]
MLDQLSPAAPARVRVVVLPIGQIKRARFLSFVERLQPEHVIQLGDVSPDGRPNRNMFSPLAFPTGRIIYDLTTNCPSPSHLALSPFELFREALVIIAVADALELDYVPYRGNHRRSMNSNAVPTPESNIRHLHQDLEKLRDGYPKALVHQVLIFDYVHKSDSAIPEGLIAVPPPEQCKRTTMKTIMCDISSMLLAELTTLAKSLQGLNTIESPKVTQGHWGQSGNVWPSGQSADMSRRNSVLSGDRSMSPPDLNDRGNVRMSMPAQLRPSDPCTTTPSLSGRPNTPSYGPESPAVFDQIVGAATSQPNSFASRFMTPNLSRDSSRDRVSVHGFGPGSASERSRNIGRGRVGIVIGSLYLCAGRWNDAIKELIDGATIAKKNFDHLWHAKALENILVGMLMLAWTGLDFQIPQVCYLSADKESMAPVHSSEPRSNRLVSLQNLVILLPELTERILNLYARSASNTGEVLPQLPFSETIIRMTKLLAAVHLAGSSLSDEVLDSLVAGVPLKKKPNLSTPRLNIHPSRLDITTILFRTFPSPSSPEQLALVDRITILGGIASVLGSLGYNRKKATVVREIVTVLVPGLVQARIAGAAEMGVHPAAGLAALATTNGKSNSAIGLDLGEGDVENGVDAFLNLLNQVYGVVISKTNIGETVPKDDSDEAAIARIIHDASMRSFGGQSLKIDVLRSCINLSEALPDFHGVLRFTADLLRTAGSGVAPGPRSEDASPSMSREEQIRLMNNISRTLGAATNLGIKDLAAEYWDEFLVRGIDVETLPPSRTPIPHTRNELPGATAVAASKETNPFIHNPFLRTPDPGAVDRLLIAGEGAAFKVTLQNPYDFDIDIESIKLESTGIDFQSAVQKTVIGAYRTQILTVLGTPKSPGQLKIVGCFVKVRGCRERRFPVFTDPWSPQRQSKIKTIGLATLLREKPRPVITDSNYSTSPLVMVPPKISTLPLLVIERQPVVAIKSTTLSQSAVMILEGERQRFSITLQNMSKDTPVDLLLFVFKDSTQEPLKLAMSNRDSSPAELYEMELLIAHKQALRWVRKDNDKQVIPPEETATFDMEILGKPGLTSAVIQVNYAYLGVPHAEVQDKFYTRQIGLPITVTVNASIELAHMDVLPLTGNIPSCVWALDEKVKMGDDMTAHDYCLLVLDLRNTWPSPLLVQLCIDDGGNIEEDILPGNTSRIIFPIRRIFFENPTAAIPTLDPSRQRQFVVSTGRVSADSERATREAFWYREQLLKMLNGTWTTKTGPLRTGNIDLRGIHLSQRIVDTIKVDDIGIEISVNGMKRGVSKYQVFTDTFSDLCVRVTNRSTDTVHPLLRIQPSIRNLSHTTSLDLNKKFVWNGTLQQTLPCLASKETLEIAIGMTALCRGEYEISASVEEARLQETPENTIAERGLRARASTRVLMDTLLAAKERRIWHSREPCYLTVTDEDDE